MRTLSQPADKPTIGLSEQIIESLMGYLSIIEGIQYTGFKILYFSRPAIYLTSDKGESKVVSVETAKQLVKENTHAI